MANCEELETVCKTGAPGPLLQETPAASRRQDIALLHFDSDGLAGGDEGVILRGTGHGDLVCPSAQALKCSLKTLLILIVHEHVGMRSLGAFGQFVF